MKVNKICIEVIGQRYLYYISRKFFCYSYCIRKKEIYINYINFGKVYDFLGF